MNAQIIAITNQKGGVGKTTTTVNLGVGLARQGRRVLLVDGDPQGSLTISMGVKLQDKDTVTLANLMHHTMINQPLPIGSGLVRHREGVDLLPADIELSGVEMALFNAEQRERVLQKVLEPMRSSYDYILIDCTPSLGMMTINALTCADSVIVPTQADFLSTKGLNLLFRSIANLRKSLNPKLRIDGILLTMVDSRTNFAKAIITALRESVGMNIRVFDTQIPHSVRAAECPLEGKSIFAHDKRSKVAAAYEALTKEVTELAQRSKHRSRTDGVR